MASSESIDAPNSWCRVCLEIDVRMHWVRNTRLLEVYQKLTSTKLNAEDGRPHTICYICYSHLQRCCRFSDMCHKSEQIQRDLLQCGTKRIPLRVTTNLSSYLQHNLSYPEILDVKAESVDVVKSEPAEHCERQFISALDVGLFGTTDTADAPTTMTHNLAETALPFLSIIDYSTEGNTTIQVVKEEPIDIEESTLVEDIKVNDNIISSEQLPVKVKTETNNVCALSFCCDVCNETFAMKRKLAQHMLIHFSKEQHACNICNKTFTNGSNLIKHKRIHTGEKPYSCNICNKSYSQSSHLITHKRIHTGEKPYACNICNKSFVRSSYLITHKIIHTGETPYTCNICNKSFVNRSSFNTHKKIHTGEKPYACNICNKSFVRSCNLITHKRIHTGEKPYSCNICNKSYSQSSHLIAHKRIHTGNKPYSCNICNKSFTKNSNLIRHKIIHTGKKAYACSICNKSFSQGSHLIRHKRIHTGEKPCLI